MVAAHLALLIILTCCFSFCESLYLGRFVESDGWAHTGRSTKQTDTVQFFIGLKHRVSDAEINSRLLAVSTPRSSEYGKYYSRERVEQEIYACEETKQKVSGFLRRALGPSATVSTDGMFIEVTSLASEVERAFNTELAWYQSGTKRALRAQRELSNLPQDVQRHITFITLNAPIMSHLKTSAEVSAEASEASSATTLAVTAGNREAMITFKPLCSNGALNTYNPPCKTDAKPPSFAALAEEYNNNRSSPFNLEATTMNFAIPRNNIFCYNSYTSVACGGNDGKNCTCTTKISPLPKYTQLKLSVLETGVLNKTHLISNSSFFSLTDVATPDFLSKLYQIPDKLSVKHGSNQSCAEFYGTQSYSNADLLQFLAFSGLSAATIDEATQVFGNLANNQSAPGGEAQLDVEVLMGLAPGAKTFFYNYDDANPYDASNEGFLAFVNTVLAQQYPPLVFSVSYGDVEASVFNASIPGSSAYGQQVDNGFALMGLRGLTVIFSSGDDGIGNTIIRTNEALACSQAWPAWPASSPYVLSVGATMMTDKPLPICGQPYSSSLKSLPKDDYLLVDCTEPGETVCSPVFGGVITSGGGFSNQFAQPSWQTAAVKSYLDTCSSLPPKGYFNSSGRAYPDISTYGSNFLVVLGGQIVRESGTSASAPVAAAMVTLWNDMRLAYGMPPLGFINPFLYEVAANHPEAFNDVVTGNNACGAGGYLTTAACCKESFSATPGWDAATGLGSPNFRVIAQLVINPSFMFPSSEYVSAAVPTFAPTSNSNADASGSTASSRYTSASTSGVAGAALFFSLANTLVLAAAAYHFYFSQRKRVGAALIDSGLDDKTEDRSLFNPLNR